MPGYPNGVTQGFRAAGEPAPSKPPVMLPLPRANRPPRRKPKPTTA